MADPNPETLALLRSTGAVRNFLPDSVPDAVVHRVLDTARFAPNGGNRQAWHVVVLRDPAVRADIRDAYLPGWYEYLAMRAAGLTPFAPVTDPEAEARARADAPAVAARAAREAPGFAERLDEVPVLLAVLADLRSLAATDRDLGRYTMIGGASIYPFVWSLMLAAHAEGLAGVITTMAVAQEPRVKRLLHVPDHVCLAAIVALGYPVKQITKLTRQPVEAFATVDRYDGPRFVTP
jgi:nitroreductase